MKVRRIPKPNTKEGKSKRQNTFDSVNATWSAKCEGRELTLNAFKSRIFPIKATQGKGVKILTPRQMLRRLPIAGNTSENLLKWNQVNHIFYVSSKEIIREVYNNIMNSIKM